MDGSGYGGFSGPAYPYWKPTSGHSSNPTASAPPFMTSRPVESYGPTEELSGPGNFYGYSHPSPADWPFQSGCLGVVMSQSSPSSFYADNIRPGSSRGEDSYKGTFGILTSREVSSAGSVYDNDNLYEKHRSHFVPTYNSVTLVPGSSSTILQTSYPEEPNIHPHHVSHIDFETAKGVSGYVVEPDKNNSIAPLPLSSLEPRASVVDTQVRFPLGYYGEPLPINSSAPEDVLDNYLGVQSSLQSTSIAPVNFNVLLGSGEATAHSKRLSESLDFHNPTIDSPCWTGPRVSQSLAFDVKFSDSLHDNKSEESSGAFVYPRPKVLVGDMDKDALGYSLKDACENSCENSKANESRYWNHFMVSDSEGTSVSKLMPEQSQSCDATRAVCGKPESAVSHITYFSDNANQPSCNYVQANPEACRNREQNYREDKMNVSQISKSSESRLWDNFLVSSSQGISASKFAKEVQSCDTVRVECGKPEPEVSHTTCLSDNANQPSGDVAAQANPEPCQNAEIVFSKDKMNVEKKPTSWRNLGLNERRSEADGYSNNAPSSGRRVCSLQDLPCATVYPQVSSLVNAMQNLSELLVFECSNDESRLKQEEVKTLEKVVKDLTKCLKGNTRHKTEAGETSVRKQTMSVSSPNIVKLHEIPKVGTADFQNVKPLENQNGVYTFVETVNKDEMTQNIKKILDSNFPDDKESQPQALLFKNLWLEAEAALCSTTYMARFYRIRNEIANHKLLDKESSRKASSSGLETPLNLQKSVSITESPVVDESHENDIRTMHRITGSWGLNSDSVDALLALISGSFPGSSELGSHGKLKPDANCVKIHNAIPEEIPISNPNSHVNDVLNRFQILKQREAKHAHGTVNNLDSDSKLDTDKSVRLIDRGEMSGQSSQTPTRCSLESSDLTRSQASSHVNDVMERFLILKGREAEQEQKSLNRLDSDLDEIMNSVGIGNPSSPAHGMQINDDPNNLEALAMSRHHHLGTELETCESTDDVKEDKAVSVYGTEWEHVLKEDFSEQRG